MWSVVQGSVSGVTQATVDSVLSLTQAAANYWGFYVDDSRADITIRITISDLSGTTLATGGTDFQFQNSQGGLDFFEPTTVRELRTGNDSNGSNPDIRITVDSSRLASNGFFLGAPLDGYISSPNPGQIDLFTVLLHEIGHGLGLLTFLDDPGNDRTTFDRHVTGSGASRTFNGPNAVAEFGGPIPLDDSIAHVSQDLSFRLFRPQVSSGIASFIFPFETAVLQDIGVLIRAPSAGGDVLRGYAIADVIDALGGNDFIDGLRGDDALLGAGGNDTLIGGDNNDSLDGGDGDDSLQGGNGNDTIAGGAGLNFADAGAGDDLFLLTPGADETLLGGGGADLARIVSDAAVFLGSSVFDPINQSSLDDDQGGIRGLSGIERVEVVSPGGVLLQLSVNGTTGADNLNLSAETADFTNIHAGDGDDTLVGTAGKDAIFAYGGADSVFGGAGDDVIRESSDASNSVDGGAGFDTVNFADFGDSLPDATPVTVVISDSLITFSSTGTQTAVSNLEQVVLARVSGDGGDLYDASAATIRIQVNADGGADTILGGANTNLDGAPANNLSGDAGDDSIVGGISFDLLLGADGDDILVGRAGADILDGGEGFDTADYSASSAVIIDLGADSGAGGDAEGDILLSVERVIGSSGADSLRGGAGAENLSGGANADTVNGGLGVDTLNGGTAFDTLDYSDRADGGVNVNVINGVALTGGFINSAGFYQGGVQEDTISNFENILGAGFADRLIAGSTSARIEGRGGDDFLFTFSGNDTLFGGDGNDFISTARSSDQLFGEAGDDTLNGGTSFDTLNGGAGSDTAEYSDRAGGVSVNLFSGIGRTGGALNAAGFYSGGFNEDVLTSIENAIGSAFGDRLVGLNAGSRLDGRGGNDNISGLDGADTLNGGTGNDTLQGGGGNDIFEFGAGGGSDRILDFVEGTGVADVIRLVGLGPAFDSFDEVIAAATEIGADVVFDFGGGNTVTIVAATIAAFAADDFAFG